MIEQPKPFLIVGKAKPTSIVELRVPRKLKKKIKKSKHNIFKIRCWKDTFSRKIIFDLFF